MVYINVINFLLICQLEKDHSVIETRHLKNFVIFFQTIIIFARSRNIIKLKYNVEQVHGVFILLNLPRNCGIYPLFSLTLLL